MNTNYGVLPTIYLSPHLFSSPLPFRYYMLTSSISGLIFSPLAEIRNQLPHLLHFLNSHHCVTLSHALSIPNSLLLLTLACSASKKQCNEC